MKSRNILSELSVIMSTFLENVLSAAKNNQAKLAVLALAGLVGYSFSFSKSSGKVR